jgi:PPM family protein phosphatase
VAELVQSGVLTPEEAERHPQRSAITRALGTEPTVEVDAFTVEADAGDLFLICSDGLSAMLTDERVTSAIESAGRDPDRAADALIAAANAEGGEDNITVVLFEMLDGDAPGSHAQPEVEQTMAGIAAAEVTEEDVSVDGSAASTAEPTRHGAGPGGRIAALVLIVSLLVLCLLVLYLAVVR